MNLMGSKVASKFIPDSSDERQEEDGDGDDEGDEHDIQRRRPGVPGHEGLVRSLVVLFLHCHTLLVTVGHIRSHLVTYWKFYRLF